MIFLVTWRRFTEHWPRLLLAGAFATVINLVIGGVAAALFLPLLASAGLEFGMVTMGADPTSFLSGAALVAIFSRLLLGVIVCVLLLLLAAPLIQGGLLTTAVRVLRDEPVGPFDFWEGSVQCWRRLLLYDLMLIPVWVVLMLLSAIPVLGPLFALLVPGPLMVALAYYGPYALVSEGLSPGAAMARAFRIVTERPLDLFYTWWLAVGSALLVAFVAAIFGIIPGLGFLINLTIQVALLPLAVLYMAVRYQTNIAPAFTPPGGSSHFHR